MTAKVETTEPDISEVCTADDDYETIDETYIYENMQDLKIRETKAHVDYRSDDSYEEIKDKSVILSLSNAGTDSSSISNPIYPTTETAASFLPKVYCMGISVFDNGHIVVVSSDGQILLFSESYRYLSLAAFPYNFNDVTCIDENEFAASSGCCINFFKSKNNVVTENQDKCIDTQLSSETSFHGLVHSHKRLIVTCNVQSIRGSHIRPTVAILSMKGQILSQFTNAGFVMPTNVDCSSDGHNIFVLDTKCNCIFCFDDNGKLKWQAALTKEPTYMTIVHEKNIVVGFPKEISCFCCTNGKPQSTITDREQPHENQYILAYHKGKKEIVWCPQNMIINPNCTLSSLRIKTKNTNLFKRMLSFS